jgi:hypothetical protein
MLLLKCYTSRLTLIVLLWISPPWWVIGPQEQMVKAVLKNQKIMYTLKYDRNFGFLAFFKYGDFLLENFL